jgi:hypothetical protein
MSVRGAINLEIVKHVELLIPGITGHSLNVRLCIERRLSMVKRRNSLVAEENHALGIIG